jgi:hypothetical protein
VTPKIKIGLLLIVAAVGAVVVACLTGESAGELQITYAGPPVSDSNRVAFLVSNRSSNTFSYGVTAEERQGGSWNAIVLRDWTRPSAQIGSTPERDEVTLPSTNRWRIHIAYADPLPPNALTRGHMKLALLVEAKISARLGQSLRPKERWKHNYGPVMLGASPWCRPKSNRCRI